MDQFRPVGAAGDSPTGEAPASPDGPSDPSALLVRSAAGDERAFADLYDAMAGRAFGLAVRVVRDRAQAEEVLQEAFLELWRTSRSFDPDRGSATSWVLTLVHRRAVDRVRSAEAANRRDVTYHQQNINVEHDTTAEAAHASLEARRVRKAMEALTQVQREAVELAFFGGLTHTQVAGRLDLPVGTAKTRIRDGLIRLRDTMGVGR